MKRNILLWVSVLILMTGCADLVVNEFEVTWDEENKIAKVEIANIGKRDAGNFMVHFNGDENPVSSNERPQVSHEVSGLNKGESVTLTADFKPLAHPDNNNLENVYQITVSVDPKNMVKECKENNNSRSAAVVSGSGMACVEFDPMPTAGTKYGNPVGNTPGQVVLDLPNGIKMSVHDLRHPSGGSDFNYGEIYAPPGPFGTGQSLRAGNISFEFDFTNVGFNVEQVQFYFADFGGHENFSINGQPVPINAGELISVPSNIGGVDVDVPYDESPGNKKGIVTLTGSIEKFRIGGQELWIDNICASN